MKFITNLFKLGNAPSANRIGYLDFIRGVFILLVLYHHSEAPYGRYILLFHMPALFILSGYTEYILNREKPFLTYVKSKFHRLIVPYFCFEILNLLLYLLFQRYLEKSYFTIGEAFVSIVACINNNYIGLYGRLWFLPAIFFSSVFSYLIKTHSKGNPSIIAAWCAVMFVLSYVSSRIIPHRLPFTIDTAFLGAAFSLIGYLFGNAIKNVFDNRNYWLDFLFLAVSAVVFVLCDQIADPVCLMYDNQYNDFPFMVICAIAGSAIVFIFAKYLFFATDKLPLLKKLILWYSNNSLAFFPMHLTVKIFSIIPLFYLSCYHWSSLLTMMFIFTVPAVNFITLYMPFMLGNFTRKQ